MDIIDKTISFRDLKSKDLLIKPLGYLNIGYRNSQGKFNEI